MKSMAKSIWDQLDDYHAKNDEKPGRELMKGGQGKKKKKRGKGMLGKATRKMSARDKQIQEAVNRSLNKK